MRDKSENQQSPEAQQLEGKFPNLFKRYCRVKKYEIKATMNEDAKITQKSRRIPIQLQNQVVHDIKKLLKAGQIEKANELQDDVFIQPTIITVKKDNSVKSVLDARALNQSIDTDLLRMPNLDNLIDMIAERLDQKRGGLVFVSKYNYFHG